MRFLKEILLLETIDRARDGSKTATRRLERLAAALLRDGKLLPQPLAKFIADGLEKKEKRGAPIVRRQRDIGICREYLADMKTQEQLAEENNLSVRYVGEIIAKRRPHCEETTRLAALGDVMDALEAGHIEWKGNPLDTDFPPKR